jgi:transposase-like protein
MVGHGAKFGRKKEEAIAALLVQRNVEEAARAVGIATSTLLRWLQLPEFAAAFRKARRDAFSQSIARLQQGSSAAATTLLKIMLDQNAPTSTRVRAAECVMNHAMKAIELEDIEARVRALEEATQQTGLGQ